MTDNPCARLCSAITQALPDLPDTVEVYATVALSTGHLTQEDVQALNSAADDPEDTRVLSRSTGFFIKLDDSIPENGPDADGRHGTSETLPRIVAWAKGMGFQCIEFDCDAETINGFPVYE